MSIIGFVPDPDGAATVVAWASALADKDEEIKYLCLDIGCDGLTEQAVRGALGDKDGGGPTLVTINDPMPIAVVLEHARRRTVRLLISHPFALSKVGGKPQTSDELLRSAPCQTLIPLYGDKVPDEFTRILFVSTAQGHDRATLRLANALRQRRNAQVTIGGIEVDTGAEAGEAGKSWIRALLHELALPEDEFEIKVVVDSLKHRGIIELFESQDLVMIGMDGASYVRPLQQSLSGATVAVVKRTPPLRLRGYADWMPRINPADHADLLNNLHIGSSWGPDFIAMLALASAIASLGLVQNSPAVVIGSMLLAPLMTPMIGLGLGLAQVNLPLMRQCAKSIGFGFLLTLVISFLVGIGTPAGEILSEEVLSRGSPNVIDLLIAVFAAGAATFAMARPNIAGAIAGVAIATALVPPVCSVGISIAHGEFAIALGASLLFFTNLIAILVVSNFVFSLLGITSARALPRNRKVTRVGRYGLVAILLLLAGPLSFSLLKQLDEGKRVPLANPVTWAVRTAIYDRVAQEEGVEVMLLARPRAERLVLIHIASQHELPQSFANELRVIVREAMHDSQMPVSVIAVRGFWRDDSDSP